MTTMAWWLSVTLLIHYGVGAFTVGLRTFRKGHTRLGVVGFLVPLLWLIGATLPAKRRSRYAVQQALQYLYEIHSEKRRRTWEARPTPRLRWEHSGSDWEYPGSEWRFPEPW